MVDPEAIKVRIAEQEEARREAERRQKRQALHDQAKELHKTMRCNCDLDNWEPEQSTGHSWVCRIHRKIMGLPEKVTRYG